MGDVIKIGISGIQGYVGQELVKLIQLHPHLELSMILAKESNSQTECVINQNQHNSIPLLAVEDVIQTDLEIDILILATPPEASIKTVTLLKDSSVKIIDLSGAFRLPKDQLKLWYGLSHNISSLFHGASYALSPWASPQLLTNKVLANPGCYAACALMTLIPLLQKELIKPDIIIDAKSGVSGAGKKPAAHLMFCEITENFFPYKVGQHQHIPEIKQCISNYIKETIHLNFVTQLLPVQRGISMSLYLKPKMQFKSDIEISNKIQEAYDESYSHYPLLQFCDLNQTSIQQSNYLLSLKNVVKTANTHISFHVHQGMISIFACIDNLLKGAASQAIEIINTIYHFPLNTGLQSLENQL